MPIPFKLDYVIEKALRERGKGGQPALRRLARYFENLTLLQEDHRARAVGPTSLAAFERAMGGTRSPAR